MQRIDSRESVRAHSTREVLDRHIVDPDHMRRVSVEDARELLVHPSHDLRLGRSLRNATRNTAQRRLQ